MAPWVGSYGGGSILSMREIALFIAKLPISALVDGQYHLLLPVLLISIILVTTLLVVVFGLGYYRKDRLIGYYPALFFWVTPILGTQKNLREYLSRQNRGSKGRGN